jgi:competence protein ComEA
MAIRGGWLLLLLILGMTVYDLGWISFLREKSPALFLSTHKGAQILLMNTETEIDGVHQFIDAQQLLDVIKLAELTLSPSLHQRLLDADWLKDGKCLNFIANDRRLDAVEFGYMPAALRMSLGVPLDVNQMSAVDWDDLPGVGASLALRIETDRQKNGEYVSLDDLMRVKGVGIQRIEKWRSFFMKSKVL